jgi:prepilin-type N-terminal cleavage/methylation domain-containing protein
MPARPRGFSLVEMMVVVMIVLAIAAIAVPRMLQARMMANEASAIASMRVVREAEEMYRTSYPAVGYAGSLADLGSHGSNCESTSKTNACLIMDTALAAGMKGGYTFELLADGNTPAMAYTLTATPDSLGTTGRCTFVSDQTGSVHQLVAPTSRFSAAPPVNCDFSS